MRKNEKCNSSCPSLKYSFILHSSALAGLHRGRGQGVRKQSITEPSVVRTKRTNGQSGTQKKL